MKKKTLLIAAWFISVHAFSQKHAFLAKFDAAGNNQWITTDAGPSSLSFNIQKEQQQLVLTTSMALQGNHSGLFIKTYDSIGKLLQSVASERATVPFNSNRIKDEVGSLFTIGSFRNTLQGIKSQGKADLFLIKYNAANEIVWFSSLGTEEDDQALGLLLDEDGSIYVSGFVGSDKVTASRKGNHQEGFSFKVNPNPVSDILYISIETLLKDEAIQIQMINTAGQTIKTQNIQSANTSISVEGLPKGVYFIKATGRIGSKVEKVVVH